MIRKSTIVTLGIIAAVGFGNASATAPMTLEQSKAATMAQDGRIRSIMSRLSGKNKLSDKMAQPTGKVANGEQAAAVGSHRAAPKRLSEQAKRIKPGTCKTFGWYGTRWLPEDNYSYVYDGDGNVVLETNVDAEGGYYRTVSEYDDNGMVKFQETMVSSDGVNYENNVKREFEYDPIVTNVITKRTEWMWLGGEWKLVGNNYKRIIARDEAGNVTGVTIAVLYEGKYDPTERLTITYGENGEAVEMVEEILDYDGKEYFWEEGIKATNLVWERTNGQLLDTDDLFSGANRVKSCTLQEPDGVVMDAEVEYAEDSDAYTATYKMTMEGMTMNGTLSYTPLENEGGLIEQEVSFMGMSVLSTSEELRNDEWGLMTLYQVTASAYGESEIQGQRGEVEYDAEGRPEIYTVSEFYIYADGEEESEYIIRAEYGDYVDVATGVSSVAASSAEGKWYDLQGRQVSGKGLHGVVIKDGKAVMIR